MSLAGTHVPMLGQLPMMAAASVCVPRVSSSCLLPLQKALQDQQVGLTQTPFKWLLLPWLPEHVRFCVVVESLSHVWLFGIPWTVAYQAPLSMGISRQEYWTDCHFLLGDLPDLEIKPASLALAGGFFTTEPPGKPHEILCVPFNSEVFFLPLSGSPDWPSDLNLLVIIFLVQDPQTGESNVGLDLFAPCGDPLQLWLFSHLWVTYPGVWLCLISTPSTCLLVVPSLYL